MIFIKVIIAFFTLGVLTERDTVKSMIFTACFVISMAVMLVLYVLEKGLV